MLVTANCFTLESPHKRWHFSTKNVTVNENNVISLPVLWHCWLGGRKSIRPAKMWVMRCWHGYLSATRCKWFAYGPADATATPSSLASLKSRLV